MGAERAASKGSVASNEWSIPAAQRYSTLAYMAPETRISPSFAVASATAGGGRRKSPAPPRGSPRAAALPAGRFRGRRCGTSCRASPRSYQGSARNLRNRRPPRRGWFPAGSSSFTVTDASTAAVSSPASSVATPFRTTPPLNSSAGGFQGDARLERQREGQPFREAVHSGSVRFPGAEARSPRRSPAGA
jgi:hypothetical protein